MKLYFQNSYGKERLIAEVADESSAIQEIHKFLDDHNFKCYYIRIWANEKRTWFDVGSHTEFFILDTEE